MEYLLNKAPINLKDKGLTKFAQAMPDEYKNESVTEAYRVLQGRKESNRKVDKC